MIAAVINKRMVDSTRGTIYQMFDLIAAKLLLKSCRPLQATASLKSVRRNAFASLIVKPNNKQKTSNHYRDHGAYGD